MGIVSRAPDPDSARVAAILAAVAPALAAAERDAWTAALVPAMRAGALLTPYRAAMFLGQCAEETAFRVTEESLYYTTAARICATWPTRFPTLASAAPYVREPMKLANHVYALREGNGPESSGDGWQFRGGGLLQVTFRNAHTQLGQVVGKSPEACADWIRNTKEGAATGSVWAWQRLGCTPYADGWSVAAVSGLLNAGSAKMPTGAIVNYAERVRLCQLARQAAVTE